MYTSWFQLLQVTWYVMVRNRSKKNADTARCWNSILGEVLPCPSASAVCMHLPSRTNFYLIIHLWVSPLWVLTHLSRRMLWSFNFDKESEPYFYVSEGEDVTFCRIYKCSSCWQQSIHFHIADWFINMHEDVYSSQQKYRWFWIFFVNVTDPHIPLIWSEGKTILLVKRQKHESGPGLNWYFNQAISISFCRLQYLKFFVLVIL